MIKKIQPHWDMTVENDFVLSVVNNKVWDHVPASFHVISTGKRLSLAALEQAYYSLAEVSSNLDVLTKGKKEIEKLFKL